MKYTELHDGLSDEQGGGRRGRSAIDQAGNMELMSTFLQLKRQNCAINPKDATACFDLILESVSNMANKAQGQPDRYSEWHEEVAASLKNHPKTAAGVSTHFYSHRAANPVHGEGQGAGDAPPRWIFISDPMIKAYNEKGHIPTFTNPERSISFRRGASSFIDDTALIHVLPEYHQEDNQRALGRIMTTNANLWNGLTHATGGQLNLAKCSHTVL
jgi:hypothetical protein